MGMRIRSTGAAPAETQTNGTGRWQDRKESFQALLAALEAGDLSAAQQAGAKLKELASAGSPASTNSPAVAPSAAALADTSSTPGTDSGATATAAPAGTFKSELAQLLQFLEEGDLPDAQTAAKTLQAQNTRHHHRHHYQAGAGVTAGATALTQVAVPAVTAVETGQATTPAAT